MEGGSAQYYYHFELVPLPDGSTFLMSSSALQGLPLEYYITLDDVLGNIYLLAKDPHGCRFLMMKCAEGRPEHVEKIFVEIIDHIVELMADPHGNHLVQKLLEVCTNGQKMRILDEITRRPGDFVRFSFDAKGTWVVQKVIETLSTPEQSSLIASSLKPRILDLMNDSIGSGVARRCLQHLSPEYKEYLFEDAVAHCSRLAKECNACFVLQDCLRHCDGELRRRLVCGITSDALNLSQHPYGTRVVQKVIETLSTPEQFSLIASSLKPRILDLMNDSIGSGVARCCLQHLSPEYKEYLFEDAVAHCSRLAKECNACCVLQACLHHCDGEFRRRLVCGITSDALNLSQHPYGNYIVQYVLDLKLPWATASLLVKLEGSYGYLSMQKYGSHVLEKCLYSVGEDRRPRIVQELISNCLFDQILQHQYGSYVIRTALRLSTGDLLATLIEAIMSHAPALRTSPYGKLILDILTNSTHRN